MLDRGSSYSAIKDEKGVAPTLSDTVFSFFSQPIAVTAAVAIRVVDRSKQHHDSSTNEGARLVKTASRSTDYGTFSLI